VVPVKLDPKRQPLTGNNNQLLQSNTLGSKTVRRKGRAKGKLGELRRALQD